MKCIHESCVIALAFVALVSMPSLAQQAPVPSKEATAATKAANAKTPRCCLLAAVAGLVPRRNEENGATWRERARTTSTEARA
jgi:hypothetical protein